MKTWTITVIGVVLLALTGLNFYTVHQMGNKVEKNEIESINNMQLIFNLTRANSCLLHIRNVILLPQKLFTDIGCDVVIKGYEAELAQ